MAPTRYHLPLLVLLWLFSYTLQDDACRTLGCGEGRCVRGHNRSRYHCECNRGWKTIMVAPMPFPSCIVPNCTMDFSCGHRTPPPPRAPQPSFNITNVCNLVWCGEGHCVADGTRHRCRCRDGADHLTNSSTSICIRRCTFKADCRHLGIGLASSPPPAPSPPSGANSLDRGKKLIAHTVAQLPLIAVVFTSIVI